MQNGAAPRAITIADQNALSAEHAVVRISEVARDLEHHGFIGMRRAADVWTLRECSSITNSA